MFGRAGRPHYDTLGEGILITSRPQMSRYIGLLNNQLKIKSNLLTQIYDFVNSFVSNKEVKTLKECYHLLKRTLYG